MNDCYIEKFGMAVFFENTLDKQLEIWYNGVVVGNISSYGKDTIEWQSSNRQCQSVFG